MYLKSLTLKGFKSFADRTVLQMEPGITAIVGPNGSGKSNISDAVLWVLGERNVRNLRGQAMEDVIFAGSSARKSTSFAEVELVLDNSDGVLPMDFTEVVIARRMYRTGESEYLINGSVSRRMDVLDILHDSGLGQGTHSIISQGSIDSILASKPEDRRALIEEAAGVLKHKQRMERSSRKLERIKGHVERISDVVAEVARQLGPLERKAKRAQRHAELKEELIDVSLALAVDDLRRYQGAHEDNSRREKELTLELSRRKEAIDEADRAAAELQRKIREDSQDAGEISKRQRLAASAYEHIEASIAVARERRRQAMDRAGEIELALEQSVSEIEGLEKSLAKARLDAEDAEKAYSRMLVVEGDLKEAHGKADTEKDRLEKERKLASDEIVEVDRRLGAARQERALTQESLTNGLARFKVLEDHRQELELRVEKDGADAENARVELESLNETLESLTRQDKAARELVAKCANARDAARAARDEAASREQSINAQIEALEALEAKRLNDAGDAKRWIFDHRRDFDMTEFPLSHAVKVDPDYESLVEMLLGGDMGALGVDDAQGAKKVLDALATSGERGEMTILELGVRSLWPERDISASLGNGRFALMDKVECEKPYAQVINALLGDVVVCPSIDDAIDAHAKDEIGLRFVVANGDAVYPSGKISVGCANVDDNHGILSRIRHMDELKDALKDASEVARDTLEKTKEAERSLSDAQQESLKSSERLAELKGAVQSARAFADQTHQKYESGKKDLAEACAKRLEAERVVDSAKPDMERLDGEIANLEERHAALKAEVARLDEALEPVRERASAFSKELQGASLDLAKASEKKSYAELIAERHMNEIRAAKERISSNRFAKKAKAVSAKRIADVIAALDLIAASSSAFAARLDEEAGRAQENATGLHAKTEELRKRSNEAHAAFDEANGMMADIRVEKTRIEMQVESAIATITGDLGTSLETAIQRPEVENRQELEEAKESLDRRISSLGTINPDAAREYEELKERHDYLASQLHDLSGASASLAKINRLIESRMRDDFATTFEQINLDFQEVFSMLFPGGAAKLSLEDPDDLENTGVEVHAQPAGKRIAKMSLMSGGEKSLTALALLFALYRTRPTPFYILDEVEAALDDTNLRRLSAFIDAMRDDTQMIMITHQRRTMEMADVLFGVSMQADGVTKVISQKLEAALRHAG